MNSTMSSVSKDSFDISGLSSNIISDFGPVLSLFGEQAARQFMSQSMGWADNIIFAMAPLGILTAIVGAIRVGGPGWLKTIIGRARENRTLAEIELMSSTSHEVCELWNGQNIVRLMGAPEVRELMHFSDCGPEEECGLYTLEEIEKLILIKRKGGVLDIIEKDAVNQNVFQNQVKHGKKLSKGKALDNNTKSAPNISLNLHSPVNRLELRLVAFGGILIQLGVVTYAICAVKTLGLKKIAGFSTVKDWALCLSIVGTGAVVIGLLLCSCIIEYSTIEERYRVKDNGGGSEVHILWVQKGDRVNDQVFSSYATFAKDKRSLITTSRRNGGLDSEDDSRARWFKSVTVFAVSLSFGGFIIQFIGLRGMHWTVSVAYLSATLLMTTLRALVRRGLAEKPHNVMLPEGYEIDWLATRMASVDGLSRLWEGSSHDDSQPSSSPPSSPAPETFWDKGCLNWGIQTAVKNSGYIHKKPGDKLESHAQKVLKVRQRLGLLTQWPSPYADLATSVATAIEVVMNTPELFSSSNNEFSWAMNASTGERIWFKVARENNAHWRANLAEIEAALSLWLFSVSMQGTDQSTGRNPSTGNNPPSGSNPSSGNIPSMVSSSLIEDDNDKGEWLRSGMASRKQGIRLLGRSTNTSRRDMQWWIGGGIRKVFEVYKNTPEPRKNMESDSIELHSDRVVGFAGWKLEGEGEEKGNYLAQPISDDTSQSICREEVIITHRILLIQQLITGETIKDPQHYFLATVSEAPSELLFAQAIFSAFMWALVKSPDVRQIQGKTTVQQLSGANLNNSAAWRSLNLQNTILSKMAQSIQKTGLGDLDEVYMSILPPLSSQNKLPDTSGVVDFIHQKTRKHELDGNWNKVGEMYLWAFQACILTDPTTKASIKATAALTEFLHTITTAEGVCEKQQYPIQIKEDLKSMRLGLLKELERSDRKVLRKLAELYERQGRGKGCETWNSLKDKKSRRPSPSGGHNPTSYLKDKLPFGHTQLHLAVLLGRKLPPGDLKMKGLNEVDVLGWTPLHYAISAGNDQVISTLLKAGADLESGDIRDWTPLHYAAESRTLEQNWPLARVAVNVQGRDGFAPLHCAVRSGNLLMAELLIQFGANLEIHDSLRRRPLHWAAFDGSTSAVQLLIKAGASVRATDEFGRTPLHQAAMQPSEEVVEAFRGASKLDINAKGGDLQTAIQIAALRGYVEVVKKLLEMGADVNSQGGESGNVLQAAARAGSLEIVNILLEHGADTKVQCGYYGNPLQATAAGGHSKVAKVLLGRPEIDVNAHGGHYGNALIATAVGGHLEVANVLLADPRIDVNAQGGEYGTALQATAARGHLGVAKALLAAPTIDVNAEGGKYGTALVATAAGGHLEVANALLADPRIDVNAQGGEYGTALQATAARGHLEVAKALLAAPRIDVNAKGGEFGSALQAAAAGGHVAIVKILLESNADINLRGGKYGMALLAAFANEHHEIVDLLMPEGRDISGAVEGMLEEVAAGGDEKLVRFLLGKVNYPDTPNGQRDLALKAAAKNGHEKVVQVLLEGSDLCNLQDKDDSILLAVAKSGYSDVLKVYLDHGVKIDLANDDYGDALQAAVEGGHESVVQTLLQNNDNIDRFREKLGILLQTAVSAEYDRVAQVLLDYGADANAQGGNYGNSLQAAAANGDEKLVQMLLGSGANINAAGGEYGNALQAAAANGYGDVVQILLDNGADITAAGGEHPNAIQAAAANGYDDVVQILLDHRDKSNVDANAHSDEYDNALLIAAANGKADVVQILLDKGANANTNGGEYGNALQAAAANGHDDVVQILLKKGANVNAIGGKYGSALHAATTNKHDDMVQIVKNGANFGPVGQDAAQDTPVGQPSGVVPILPDNGKDLNTTLDVIQVPSENEADPNTTSNERPNAPQGFNTDEHSNVVLILRDNGSDLTTTPGEHSNALQDTVSIGHDDVVGENENALHAASANGYYDEVQRLLNSGADVNVDGGEYGNALQAAAANGHRDVVQLLLDKGAEVNADGGRYGTSLQAAAACGHLEIVKVLLEKGANRYAQGGEFEGALPAAFSNHHDPIFQTLLLPGDDMAQKLSSTLYAAAKNGSPGAVKFLLGNGANVNTKCRKYKNANLQNQKYGNALQAAVVKGHLDVVQILLDNEADVDASGGKYGTSLQAATARGHLEIVELLLEKGADRYAPGGEVCDALLAAFANHGQVPAILPPSEDKAHKLDSTLYAAAKKGILDAVNSLLDSGANVNAQCRKYKSPKAKYRKNGNSNAQNPRCRLSIPQGRKYGNALQAAAVNGHINVVKTLLEKGADANATGGENDRGESGEQRGEEDEGEFLGRYDRRYRGKYGSALQAAAVKGHIDVVKILLNKRAKVNTGSGMDGGKGSGRYDGKYGSALQAAAVKGRLDVVKMLLDYGVDVNTGSSKDGGEDGEESSGKYGNALQAAVVNGNREVIQLLLEKKADVNAKGGMYGTSLQAACWFARPERPERLEVVKMLLTEGADVNGGEGRKYGSPLLAAMAGGSLEVVQLLLAEGADVGAQHKEYGSPLHMAIAYGRPEAVKLLIEKGADVNAHYGINENVLLAAITGGDLEVIQLLREKEADVNAQCGQYGTPLQAAAWFGRLNVVKFFLDLGMDVNAQGGKYGSPLLAAIADGSQEVVQLLLDNGADASAQVVKFGNAIQMAARYSRPELIELLLKSGAHINPGGFGDALHVAAADGSLDMVQLLLEIGADINARSSPYETALQAAAACRKHEVVEFLLRKGADVNIQGGEHGDALKAAAWFGGVKLVKLLLDNGADVNAPCGQFGNALQVAATGGLPEVVQLLLDNGADVNAQGGRYGTALQAAAARGRLKVVKLLLGEGANINIKGGKYGNALKAAIECEHEHVEEHLKKTGFIELADS